MCFTVQLSKIIFRIAVCLKQLCYYIMLFSACQEVFSTFLKLFLFLSCSNSDILSHPTGCCQELFLFLFDSFVISVRSLRRNSDRIPPLAGFVNNFLNFSYNLFIRVIYHISCIYLCPGNIKTAPAKHRRRFYIFPSYSYDPKIRNTTSVSRL